MKYEVVVVDQNSWHEEPDGSRSPVAIRHCGHLHKFIHSAAACLKRKRKEWAGFHMDSITVLHSDGSRLSEQEMKDLDERMTE